MPKKSAKAQESAIAHTELVTDPRRLVSVEPERIVHVSSTDFPGHYPDEDHSWNLEKFKQRLKLKVTLLTPRTIAFDLIGVDASIANALRRVMIAEVPTMAIEHVYFFNNTSIVQDEVLAHRMGLLPLNVDPELFDFRGPNGQATDRNTLVFKLNVTCSRTKSATKSSSSSSQKPTSTLDSTDIYSSLQHGHVFSSDIVFEPQGEQGTLPPLLDPPAGIGKLPAITNPNIVLAKLRPGQTIEAEMHAVKGMGKEHAKWSPVATASYRLLPSIQLIPPNPTLPLPLAHKFAQCFSPGVIDVKPHNSTKSTSTDSLATLSLNPANLRADTVSRNVFVHPEFEGMVKLSRVRDWFLFTIETESAYTPERILPTSIRILRSKIHALKAACEQLVGDAADSDVGDADVAGGENAAPEAIGKPVVVDGTSIVQAEGDADGDGDVVMMDS